MNKEKQEKRENNFIPEKMKAIAPTLKTMQSGETEVFPIEKSTSVKSTCTLLGATKGFVFKTTQDRKKQTIAVTKL